MASTLRAGSPGIWEAQQEMVKYVYHLTTIIYIYIYIYRCIYSIGVYYIYIYIPATSRCSKFQSLLGTAEKEVVVAKKRS